ncbi:hypothetical protein [Nitrosospira multiformis]|nr:hypothetical protein [Nitrosospira multiformis]
MRSPERMSGIPTASLKQGGGLIYIVMLKPFETLLPVILMP